jgi:hypothetical protein
MEKRFSNRFKIKNKIRKNRIQDFSEVDIFAIFTIKLKINRK